MTLIIVIFDENVSIRTANMENWIGPSLEPCGTPSTESTLNKLKYVKGSSEEENSDGLINEAQEESSLLLSWRTPQRSEHPYGPLSYPLHNHTHSATQLWILTD